MCGFIYVGLSPTLRQVGAALNCCGLTRFDRVLDRSGMCLQKFEQGKQHNIFTPFWGSGFPVLALASEYRTALTAHSLTIHNTTARRVSLFSTVDAGMHPMGSGKQSSPASVGRAHKGKAFSRLIRYMAFIFAALWFTAGMATADLNSAAQSLSSEFNATRQLVQEGREEALAYANKASAELAEVSARLDRAQAELDALKAEFDELLEIENALSVETGDYAEDLTALENIIKVSAAEFDQVLRESIINAQYPERKAALAPLLEKARFPGMEDIENLVNAYFSEIEESGKSVAYNGSYINREGNAVDSRIYRVGKFESLYSNDGGKVGFLRYEPAIGQLLMTSGDPEARYLKTAKKYLQGASNMLPIDMTAGFIVTELGAENWLKYIIRAGGIVIWPLLIIAVVAILLCLERIIYLWRIPTRTDKVMQELGRAIGAGDFESSAKICNNNKRMPLCKVAGDVTAGFKQHARVTKELLEDLLDESILKETPKLERFLTTLATLGAVSPLLGLLGTVTGMIHTFQSITVFGTGDPRLLAGGISEALITTQVGLSIAIPVLLVHHFLSRRVEKIEDDLDEKGTALITTLRKEVYATQGRNDM